MSKRAKFRKIVEELKSQSEINKYKNRENIFYKLFPKDLCKLKFNAPTFADWINKEAGMGDEFTNCLTTVLGLKDNFWNSYEVNEHIKERVAVFLNPPKEIELKLNYTYHKDEDIELIKEIDYKYKSGLYNDVINSIEENKHLLTVVEISMLYAHSLGSIKRYEEAYKILGSLDIEEHEKLVDLKTSAVSNYRRVIFENGITSEEDQDKIRVLLDDYKNLYSYKDINHYYPAVNYAYMIKIAQQYDVNIDDKIEDIYKEVKGSIKIDKDSKDYQDRYYAGVAEVEFDMLKGKIYNENVIVNFLDNFQENILPMVERTMRQMEFYRDSIGIKSDDLNQMIETIKDFVDYKKDVSKAILNPVEDR